MRLPFPGRLLHRKVHKNGTVVEVRTKHTLWPTMSVYWDKVNGIAKEIGSSLGLSEYASTGIDVMEIASKSRRLH